jgi:hypothetical protein
MAAAAAETLAETLVDSSAPLSGLNELGYRFEAVAALMTQGETSLTDFIALLNTRCEGEEKLIAVLKKIGNSPSGKEEKGSLFEGTLPCSMCVAWVIRCSIRCVHACICVCVNVCGCGLVCSGFDT